MSENKQSIINTLGIFCLLIIILSGVVQCKLEIKILTEETLKEEVAFSNWLILFCEKGTKKCGEGEKGMEELAELHKVANLGFLDCGQFEDLCLDYGVGSKNSPSFILHYEPNKKATVYEGGKGGMNITDIYAKTYFRINGDLIQLFGEHFVDHFPAEISKPERKKDIKWKIRSFANNDLPFFVLFYNTWCMHSKLFIGGVWKDMAVTMKGIANIAKVDCTAEAQLCTEEEVSVTPTVKLYWEGEVNVFDRDRNFGVFLSEWAPENLIDFYNLHLHSSVPYPIRHPPPNYSSPSNNDLV